MLTLQPHNARKNRIHHEGSDTHEHQRVSKGQGAQDPQLIVEPLRRSLIPPRVRAAATISFQQTIDRRNHRCRRCARREVQTQIVEGAIHVIGHGKRAIVHPHDAETLVVRQRLTRPRLEHKLRRKPDAADAQCFAPTIDHRHQLIADAHLVFERKGLTQDYLAPLVRTRKSPAAQKYAVEFLLTAILRQRNNLPSSRLGNSGQIQRHIHHHPRLDRCHSRQIRHPLGHRQWRTLQSREHIRHRMLLVIQGPRSLERQDQTPRHDHHRQATGHHQTYRQDLTFHPAKVSQQLTVERMNHFSTTSIAMPAGAAHCDANSRSARPTNAARDPPSRPSPRCA